jgi:hypothetical protein
MFTVGEEGRVQSLGMQRVSVSCKARQLSNVRDEAVGEGGVSSDSHSSRRVGTCAVQSCWYGTGGGAKCERNWGAWKAVV